jgi:DNA-binding transcriptional LysR family regulator
MRRVSSRQIEAFRAVMVTGSVTAAAELLSITQPATSRLLHDFEAISDLQLFERRANYLIPTQDAVKLAEEIERSFVGIDRIEQFIGSIRNQKAGAIRIAAMPALATEVLPRFIGRFIAERPDLDIGINSVSSIVVPELVAAGEADFGYVAGAFNRPGFYIEEIKSPVLIAMPKDHVLSKKKQVRAEDLTGQSIIGTFGHLFQAKIDLALEKVPHRKAVNTRFFHIACTVASQGGGVVFADPYCISCFLDRGLVARPFVPTMYFDYRMLVATRRPPTPIAETFIAEFRRHLATLRETIEIGSPR